MRSGRAGGEGSRDHANGLTGCENLVVGHPLDQRISLRQTPNESFHLTPTFPPEGSREARGENLSSGAKRGQPAPTGCPSLSQCWDSRKELLTPDIDKFPSL